MIKIIETAQPVRNGLALRSNVRHRNVFLATGLPSATVEIKKKKQPKETEMKKLNIRLIKITNAFAGKTSRLLIMLAVIALFVLSAAAPNATIGIGK